MDTGSVVRRFLISEASVSQTYQEERRSIRTIHNKNQIEDTFTNSKGEASVEFTVYLTKEDGVLLSWFGMGTLEPYKFFPDPFKEPLPFDLYLVSNGALYKVSNVYCRTLSFNMSKSNPLSVSVSATGSNWEEVQSIPSVTESQESSLFKVGSISGIEDLAGISLELTRSIDWRNTKYLQNALEGEIYTPQKITSENYSISGTITKYKKDDSLSHSIEGLVEFTYGDLIEVRLEPCKLLDRWETGDVHRKMTDFMALPNLTNSFIHFI